jgi:hypothetical protein
MDERPALFDKAYTKDPDRYRVVSKKKGGIYRVNKKGETVGDLGEEQGRFSDSKGLS